MAIPLVFIAVVGLAALAALVALVVLLILWLTGRKNSAARPSGERE